MYFGTFIHNNFNGHFWIRYRNAVIQIFFTTYYVDVDIYQDLPPVGGRPLPSQLHCATVDATKMAKILAKIMKIFILINFYF